VKKRLRISAIVVQPYVVWDDGEELMPGPSLEPITVKLSELAGLAERLPQDVAGLAEKIVDD
jgi:hypothetical protein